MLERGMSGSNSRAEAIELAPMRFRENGASSDEMTQLDVHETNHRFYCFGLCITGPPEHDCDFQLVFLGIYVAVLVAYGLVSGFLLFPYFPYLAMMPILFVGADMVAFFLAGCTDPGVAKPQPDLGQKPSDPSIRFCDKCKILQIPEQRHCTFCDCCVYELDHHCGVVGNCIGARNKIHFAMLVLYYGLSFISLFASIAFIVIVTVIRAAGSDGEFSNALSLAAHITTGILGAIFAISILFYALAYFGCCGEVAYRIFCCIPAARPGSNFFVTGIGREPCCCGLLSVPRREFFPESKVHHDRV